MKYFFRDADVSFSEVQISFGKKTLEGVRVRLRAAAASHRALGSWGPICPSFLAEGHFAETLPYRRGESKLAWFASNKGICISDAPIVLFVPL